MFGDTQHKSGLAGGFALPTVIRRSGGLIFGLESLLVGLVLVMIAVFTVVGAAAV